MIDSRLGEEMNVLKTQEPQKQAFTCCSFLSELSKCTTNDNILFWANGRTEVKTVKRNTSSDMALLAKSN